jgi:hypothetical protein
MHTLCRYQRLTLYITNGTEAGTESELTALRRRMWSLIRDRQAWSVALALAGGAWMRLWMLNAIPQISGDAPLYGNLAKNLLQGRFAITDGSGVAHETLIRLPGYPLFLAACFRLFGLDNYTAVSCIQIALELVGCLLLAAFVRRIASPIYKDGAAHWTLWIAALCPFTAAYAVAPLTETPTLFAIELALWALTRFVEQSAWGDSLALTFAVCFAALLRPDGALVGVALAPALVLGLRHTAIARGRLVRMGIVCILLALIPFGVWTARNWRAFHVFMPLAPRYANDPGEATNPGWQRWMKTWCLNFVSTSDIYWNVPNGPFDLTKLPARAFDSPEQYAETAALAAAYNDNGQDLSPELDARFAQLADERVKANPLRYYVWLPLGRMADMWLRPRVENLNIDLDWWVYRHHYSETRFSWAYAGLNAAYLLLAMVGLCFRPKYWQWMVTYFLMRSVLLLTIEAPEARYTLECFPMVFALAGIGIYCGYKRVMRSVEDRTMS